MFKMGEVIPAVPVSFSEGKQEKGERIREAKVVYIHPEGRFYTLEFTCSGGESFRESRLFTDEEREAGRREGLFRRVKAPVKQRNACPPGFIMNSFDEENESIFIGGFGEKKKQQTVAEEPDAAMF